MYVHAIDLPNESLDKALVDKMTKHFFTLYGIWEFIFRFYKTRALDAITIQLNPVLILRPYSFKIYFTIIFHLHQDLSCHLYPLGFLTVIWYTFPDSYIYLSIPSI